MGDRDPEQDDFVLTENLPGSLEFNGNASWADVTVAIVDFEPLTANVDVISTEWTFRYRDGSEDILEVDMTESNATSCRFYYNLGLVNIYTISAAYSATGPGTFLFAMIRIIAPEGVLEQDSSINTFDREWDLKRLDFSDGEFEYVVDDQDNAVVFLPAAYAHSHIQCKNTGEYFTVYVGPMSFELSTFSGLLIMNDPIDDLIDSHLSHWKRTRWQLQECDAYLYRRDDLFGFKDTSVETEIYWRFVGDRDLTSVFMSREEWERDIAYRKDVIASTEGATFGFPTEANPRHWNPDFWSDWRPYVRSDRNSEDAVEDIFLFPAEYSMECSCATLSVSLHAISTAWKGTVTLTDLVDHYPYDFAMKYLNHYWRPERYQWIPGDAGYITNMQWDGNPNHLGWNIIYVGLDGNNGCFETDEGAFLNTALFWAHTSQDAQHPLNRRTLAELEAIVMTWHNVGVLGEAKTSPRRTYLFQPLP